MQLARSGYPARQKMMGLIIGATILVACLLVAVMIMLVRSEPAASPVAGSWPIATGLPTGTLPSVEPMKLLDVSQDDARRINARVPFVTNAIAPAAPFHLSATGEDAERAIDCLASAAYYEAGDDPVGERAVVQVVLNRVRHPAFPASICGVVFQGSERRTGCQFTFTCDGAMIRRKPSTSAWQRARALALAGLNGSVFAAVGLATHYHTDWVVPYWSARLDKIAAVGTHLFFRWPGGWGQPRAFAQRTDGAEPQISRLAALSPSHGTDGPGPASAMTPDGNLPPPTTSPAVKASTALPTALLRTNRLVRDEAGDNMVVIALDADAYPGSYALTGQRICASRQGGGCTILGWLDPARIPAHVDATAARRSGADFYYFRDLARGREVALWNCARFPRASGAQCL